MFEKWKRKTGTRPTISAQQASAASDSRKDKPRFVKVFASPGIDSHIYEQGVFNSGASLSPQTPTLKTPPYDWGNEMPEQGYATGRLIGAFGDPAGKTKAKGANHISVRKRGTSPWGGFFHGGRAALAMQHPGGIVDTNTGCSPLIAGGPGQGSTLVRVKGGRPQRGMKLPVLPQNVKRGGIMAMPTGGGSHDPLTAPLRPMVPGFVSIFSFKQVKPSARPAG
jgi:hypothetical protein